MNIIYKNILPTDVQHVQTPIKKVEYYDYVGNDGILYKNQVAESVMVTAEEDLANLPDVYPPGTFAYTAGWQSAWQLAADGTWIGVLTGGSDE